MIGELKTIVLDTADIERLSAFYGELAGWTKQYGDDEWITMTTGNGWRIGFQSAPDHVAPQWPGQVLPQQAHLDFHVAELESASAEAVRLGATLLNKSERWHTLADPAGHPFDLCVGGESPASAELMWVMLDCPDSSALSKFYAALLGKPVTYDTDGMGMVGTDKDHPVLFQQVADYRAPSWPDPASPQQFHLDISVTDIEEAEPKVLEIGAVKLPGDGDNWRVYADPAGKPFCLVWNVS
jgi:predicted enzyme related to lactoylglutathione lyase